MTQIIRIDNINGGDFTQEIINRFSVQTIAVAPQEIRTFFQEKHGCGFDPYNSVVLFDFETNCIYGYILAHTSNIHNADALFEGQTKIIEYLKNGVGLYVSTVVLRNEIKETPLIQLLNTIHFAYCNGDLNKIGLYIWIELDSVLFSPTSQDEGFWPNALNKVSKVFYDKCIVLT